MLDWVPFIWAVASAAALTFIPGFLCARILNLPRWLALAVSPSFTSGVFGVGAIIGGYLGLRWSLWIALATTSAVLAIAAGLRYLNVTFTQDREPKTTGTLLFPHPPNSLSALAVLGSAVISITPILAQMPGPDAVLQRWDALFHLNALAYIRKTGQGSTLDLGALSYTDGRTGIYPAGFHDIAALVPLESVPIALNGAVLAMSVMPWAYGMAALARAVWPRLTWAPAVASCLALLAPAAPFNEWVHLSPIPNLVGFAFFPGIAAFLIFEWRALLCMRLTRREVIASSFLAIVAIAGLALVHPNVLIALSVLSTVVTFAGVLSRRKRGKRHAWLYLIPMLSAAPTIAIVLLPGSAMTGKYVGGLVVPWWQALGEFGLGLLTVWPMAIGTGIWLLAWIGSWTFARRGSWTPLLCGLVVAVLYLDAAVDSPMGLSALWYRGQDRISMLVTVVAIVFAIAGIAHLHRYWLRSGHKVLPVVITCALTATLVFSSIPTRSENAALNMDLDLPGRPRFFDTEEWEMLKSVGPSLDHTSILLASPFSGGSHLFAMSGQPVAFKAAGQQYTDETPRLIAAPLSATTDPSACQELRSHHIGYVYVDSMNYNYASGFDPLLTSRLPWGEPLAKTTHSALYKVNC